MKYTASNIKEKLISKYIEKKSPVSRSKSTDINVLLNRVKTNQKNESRKNYIFLLQHLQVIFIWSNNLLTNLSISLRIGSFVQLIHIESNN